MFVIMTEETPRWRDEDMIMREEEGNSCSTKSLHTEREREREREQIPFDNEKLVFCLSLLRGMKLVLRQTALAWFLVQRTAKPGGRSFRAENATTTSLPCQQQTPHYRDVKLCSCVQSSSWKTIPMSNRSRQHF